MKIIGITGGTGSGKTSVLNYLETIGASVIDCDAVYHDLLDNDAEMLAELEDRFEGVVSDGKLDRKLLGAMVFADSKALEELNAITHKFVGREVDALINSQPDDGIVAVDAIALLESDLKDRCAAVVGVIAPADVRVSRLAAREGIDEKYARLRIGAQRPNEYFIDNCDYIINNSGNVMSELYDDCKKLFDKIL